MHRSLRLVLALLGVVTSADADVHVVTPDRTGDFPTIQAAIDAASDGDVIQLTDGTFTGPGNRDVDYGGRAMTVRSQSDDPDACVIDCEQQGRGVFFHTSEPPDAELRGVGIINGLVLGCRPASLGGGIAIEGDASPIIRRCAVRACEAVGSYESGNPGCTQAFGGGIGCRGSGAPLIDACEIADNVVRIDFGPSSPTTGGSFNGGRGGGVALMGANVLEDCRIESNAALGGDGTWGGGIFTGNASAVRRTTILGNRAEGDPEYAGRGGGYYGLGLVESCTIAGNDATIGAGVHARSGAQILGCTIVSNGNPGDLAYLAGGIAATSIRIERTIVWRNCAQESEGRNLYTESGSVTLVCSAIDPSPGSVGGTGAIVEQGPQVLDDPLVCDPASCADAPTTSGHYNLAAGSPCLPASSPCGELIGALGEGCAAPVPTTVVSWGEIKSRFH